MRSRTWLAVASVLVLASALLWASWSWFAKNELRSPSDSAEAPVKLTWYHHFREEGARKWLEIGTSLFMEEHPNVAVEVISEDGNTYPNTLHNLAAVERMPDIYMSDNVSTLEEFIGAGYAMELTGRAVISGFAPEQLNGVRDGDGKIWAVPFDRNGVGVFYNREAFKRAGIADTPSTWPQFMAACRKLAQAGIQPIAAGYQDGWTLSMDLQPDMIATGIGRPSWIEDVEAGRASFAEDKEGFAAVLSRLIERFPYSGKDPFGTSWNDALEKLATGEAGMIINGTWTVDGVRSFRPDADIGMFAFPSTDDPAAARFPMKTTGGFVINPKGKHTDVAQELIRFFGTPAMVQVFQENKRGIPIDADAPLDLDPAFEELDRSYVQTGRLVDYTRFYPDFVNVELVAAFRGEIINLLYDPKHDIDKCIAALDAAFDRIRPRVSAEGR